MKLVAIQNRCFHDHYCKGTWIMYAIRLIWEAFPKLRPACNCNSQAYVEAGEFNGIFRQAILQAAEQAHVCMSRQKPAQIALQQKVDALVEFVHRGGAPLLDVFEVLETVSPAMHPNASTNYEYRFAWNDDCNPDDLEINWKRLRRNASFNVP